MFISANGAAVAQDANDFLIYNRATGDLFYDADANGSGSQLLLANLLPNTLLLQSDFIDALGIIEPNINGLKILGTPGFESLNGGANDDAINGLQSNDTINGGAGNDTIRGGSENDILTGGLGADTFKWNLTDKTSGSLSVADYGTDRVTDFSLSQNDVLDLRDLLVGETSANILNHLDITTSDNAGVTSTEIRISTDGQFAGGNYSAAVENAHITLVGVNLFTDSGTSTEATLLQNLIVNNKLIIDL